jgi:hypothetical protein
LAQIEFHDIHLPLLWLSLPATVAVQRLAVKSDLQAAAEDTGSQLMTEQAWRVAAEEIVAALPVVAILRVTTADPVAANTIAQMQAGGDAIGLIGDAGLAILLLDCPDMNADALAARLRSALRHGGVPASVAASAKPRDGNSMNDLWAVCEAELITREAAADRAAEPSGPEA